MESRTFNFGPQWVTWVLTALLILAVILDAWGTWQNNHILKDRNVLFERLFNEHAELKGKCGN